MNPIQFQPKEEILNIDHNKRLLVEKALETTTSEKAAAKALGVSSRTIGRLKRRYGIIWDDDQQAYYVRDKGVYIAKAR